MEATHAIPLREELVEARRLEAGLLARLVELAVQFEEADGHIGQFPDAVSWLAWNLGVSRRTARRWLRIGQALRDLPVLAAALAAGVISSEQVVLLLKVATPENEHDLVELAREAGTADELAEEVKALQQDAADEPDPEPELPAGPVTTMHWRGDVLRMVTDIPGADGVMVEKALLRRAEQAPKDPNSGVYRDFEDRVGEAIVQMASESLAGDGDHDRATVVVQISAEALATRSGPGWEAATRLFSEEELDRMLCDARIQPATIDASGVTVGVGRTTRAIPPWLRRLVLTRDEHCRFPGCHRSRWLHIHHRIPWSEGGPTNLDNLVALCGFHHRLLHRKHLQIQGPACGDLRIVDRNGHQLRPATYPLPANWQQIRLDHIDQQARARLAALAPP